jgi:hypothetical protein
MKTLTLLGMAVLLVLGLATTGVAAEETLNGEVMCAKCTLKKADAKECQDVLVVKGTGDATAEYYIVKNAVAEKFGHVCTGKTPATVTGTVTEKDGKKWIAATKMEKAAKS